MDRGPRQEKTENSRRFALPCVGSMLKCRVVDGFRTAQAFPMCLRLNLSRAVPFRGCLLTNATLVLTLMNLVRLNSRISKSQSSTKRRDEMSATGHEGSKDVEGGATARVADVLKSGLERHLFDDDDSFSFGGAWLPCRE